MAKTRQPTTRAERRAKTPATIPARFEPRFIEHADKRQRSIRIIKKRLARLVEDAGVDSFQKELLARRAVFLALQIETAEVKALSGEAIDEGVYAQSVNALSGLLTKLGLDKVARRAETLSSYIVEKAGQR